ncbi:MAG: LptF/LptG family permease, partial [Armatimonadetes bacterium]|nr:LptF/LptG family permease [Armatimonadota bacterium]NIO97355.1 LptF/LptG family permease [Armatimonadota bacterium]
RELKTHITILRGQERDASEFEVELPRRLALPFASLVFALIGTPLGMRSHRRSSSLGLAFTVLIVFFYYIVWNWLGVAAENGALAPAAAAWLPNIFFAATGLILIFTARK